MSLRALYDVPAPAKLNLFLHIVGRRPDGYHLLQSPFVLIDWADALSFELRGDGRLARHDLGPALPADDLCLRAARALQSASGCSLGADIHIDKQVPWGAGLGGGSSDAASTLLALNRLWALHWPRTRLAELGLRIGADVPFFIGGRHAFVEGIGERLTPFDLPPSRYAVVKPSASIATRDIFEHPGLKRDTEAVIVLGSPEEAGVAPSERGLPARWMQGVQNLVPGFAAGFGHNDLQTAAEDRCPEVAQAARCLEARYGNSRMTGSGSAVFARVADLGSAGTAQPPGAATTAAQVAPAQAPAEDLQGLPTGWVGRMCRSLARHPLAGWAD